MKILVKTLNICIVATAIITALLSHNSPNSLPGSRTEDTLSIADPKSSPKTPNLPDPSLPSDWWATLTALLRTTVLPLLQTPLAKGKYIIYSALPLISSLQGFLSGPIAPIVTLFRALVTLCAVAGAVGVLYTAAGAAATGAPLAVAVPVLFRVVTLVAVTVAAILAVYGIFRAASAVLSWTAPDMACSAGKS